MFSLSRTDALLLLMTVIWGTNYAIVKTAFPEIDPQAFNAVRLTLASSIFLTTMVVMRKLRPARAGEPDPLGSVFHTPEPITGRDWAGLIGLALVGHCLYQYCFIGGLARTSVANSSLLVSATPVVIALLTAALGHDRITPLHWVGTALSVTGMYIVIGHGAKLGGATTTGDLMIAAGVICWATYTVGARQLMVRHSPVGVTGISMALGTVLYVPLVWRHIAATPWADLSVRTWVTLVYSTLFALCVAYTIWYAAVRQIGSARTSVYSNLVPIVAMATAVLWLHEPLSRSKIVGASLVLIGVGLTRARRAFTDFWPTWRAGK